MDPKDVFVGALSITVGLGLIVVGATGWQSAFLLPKIRWMESSVGAAGARAILAAIGAALVLIGVLIAIGVRPLGE